MPKTVNLEDAGSNPVLYPKQCGVSLTGKVPECDSGGFEFKSQTSPQTTEFIMAAKNDVTGDSIKTKPSNSDAYGKGWDRIFKKGGQKKGELTIIASGKGVGKTTLRTKNRPY